MNRSSAAQMFGGAELNVEVGNTLAGQGIHLNIIYGW